MWRAVTSDIRRALRTSVELGPITDSDVPAVAEFLRANHNARVPWAAACSEVPWQVEAPNHGFMLRDGDRVVGTLLALYSERRFAGRVERFCNLGSWCVLPEYRSRSMSLVQALLAQDGYHVTVLSPDHGPREILHWMGFRSLDTSAALIPNLPWPTLPNLYRTSSAPEVIARTLSGAELALYRDHRRALAVHHLVLTRGEDSCYVMYRIVRYHGVPVFALILHISDRELFHRALMPLTRRLLVRHGVVATLAERRVVGDEPRLAFRLRNWPKMYRSPTLQDEQIDYLYSELTCVPW
jgi:hypothetical protein